MANTRILTGALVAASFALIAALATTTEEVRLQNTIEAVLADPEAAADDACKFKDDSSGVGGQSGSCVFFCKHPGTVSLSVNAGDEDATVDGSVYCAEQYEWGCSGEKSCARTANIHTPGNGKCEGSSNEAWDSGLTVECTSRVDQQGPTKTPEPNREFCPVTVDPSPPYPRICIDPPGEEHQQAALAASGQRLLGMDQCRVLVLRTLRAVCHDAHFDMARMFSLSEHILGNFTDQGDAASARIFVRSGLVVGLVCAGFDCVQADVLVSVGSAGGGVRFTV